MATVLTCVIEKVAKTRVKYTPHMAHSGQRRETSSQYKIERYSSEHSST